MTFKGFLTVLAIITGFVFGFIFLNLFLYKLIMIVFSISQDMTIDIITSGWMAVILIYAWLHIASSDESKPEEAE